MSTLIEEVEHFGANIAIYSDDDSESPRDWDNAGTLVLSHRRYDLPNEANIDFDNFGSWSEVQDYLETELDAKVILPVSMTDHSGCSYYVGAPRDPWDSGQVGFIFVTGDKLVEEWGLNPDAFDTAREVLAGEVETFNDWVNGYVHGYIATVGDKEVGSCWGFYGDPEYAISEAKGEVESYFHYMLQRILTGLAPV